MQGCSQVLVVQAQGENCHSERNAVKRRIWLANNQFAAQMLRLRLSRRPELAEGMTTKIGQFELLENDKLVTSVNVKTHTLLRAADKTDVSVLIHVIVKATMPTWNTIGLSG
jgi:hypothetical protein